MYSLPYEIRRGSAAEDHDVIGFATSAGAGGACERAWLLYFHNWALRLLSTAQLSQANIHYMRELSV
jgi:hypothetical protein